MFYTTATSQMVNKSPRVHRPAFLSALSQIVIEKPLHSCFLKVQSRQWKATWTKSLYFLHLEVLQGSYHTRKSLISALYYLLEKSLTAHFFFFFSYLLKQPIVSEKHSPKQQNHLRYLTALFFVVVLLQEFRNKFKFSDTFDQPNTQMSC